MICCTFIALLFGTIVWISRKLTFGAKQRQADPLHWTLKDARTGTPTAQAQGRKSFDWRVRRQSFRYALNGVKLVIQNEHSAWIHVAAAAMAVGAGAILHITASDWRWIILSICIVFASEVINSAIETVCDAVSMDHNTLIGQAKDMGAGAVLICSAMAFGIGAITFAPYVLSGHYLSLIEICRS